MGVDRQSNAGLQFPESKENTSVQEGNSDGWEFAKEALSELRFCGVAVQQCCGRKSERWKAKAKVEVKEKVKAGGLRQEKCQMSHE